MWDAVGKSVQLLPARGSRKILMETHLARELLVTEAWSRGWKRPLVTGVATEDGRRSSPDTAVPFGPTSLCSY